jgi:hypothetical protein
MQSTADPIGNGPMTAELDVELLEDQAQAVDVGDDPGRL